LTGTIVAQTEAQTSSLIVLLIDDPHANVFHADSVLCVLHASGRADVQAMQGDRIRT
jgi:hypothetical protein